MLNRYGICLLCLLCLLLLLAAPLVVAQDLEDALRESLRNSEEATAAGCGCGILFLILILVNLAIAIILMVWVAKDAKARGESAALWVLLMFFLSWLGLIIWLLARPKGAIVACQNCRNNKLESMTRCPHCGQESGTP